MAEYQRGQAPPPGSRGEEKPEWMPPRDDVLICTKLGNPTGTGPLDAGLSANHQERELDQSLKRLRTD